MGKGHPRSRGREDAVRGRHGRSCDTRRQRLETALVEEQLLLVMTRPEGAMRTVGDRSQR